jgi:cbb3-type cytochrome oxidase subunit 3
MKRPIPIYFITIWLFISLVTLPSRFKHIVSSTIGIEQLQLVSIVFLVISIYICFKFFKCEKAFVYLAIVIFGLTIILVNGKHIVLLLNYMHNINSTHIIGIAMIALNFYCLIYLSMSKNRKKIAEARANIIEEENRRFQLKLLNKK